jgi:hypothetical protein
MNTFVLGFLLHQCKCDFRYGANVSICTGAAPVQMWWGYIYIYIHIYIYTYIYIYLCVCAPRPFCPSSSSQLLLCARCRRLAPRRRPTACLHRPPCPATRLDAVRRPRVVLDPIPTRSHAVLEHLLLIHSNWLLT